jgi:peptidoglycan hydrolase-like protein with peptidoglycan-binding domain
MHGCVWRAGSVAMAIWPWAPPAGAVAAGDTRFAQASAPGQPPVAGVPAALPANLPEQIRKAQTELRRLDCLTGRIDGKLGDQTRQAVKKFWTSAKQPAVEVNITDELISQLAERGDGFCRPARPFFAIGGRPGGNSALPPFFAPGARPGSAPATAAPPPSPGAAD